MTPKPFTPRSPQKLMTEYMVRNNRCAVWSFMGSGKSAATLDALIKLNLIENIFPVLVVAPLRVANTVWPDEIKDWREFSHLKISAITGNLDERKKALNVKADIYTVNFENIPWLVKLMGKKWPFKTIIVDEASKLKGFRIRQGTQRSRELYKVSFPPYCDRFWELTGTPAPAGLISLYGQAHFLDQGERLGRTFTSFEQRWFSRGWDGFSLKPLPHAQAEIEAKLKDICLSIRAADHFDLKAPIVNTIRITLPPKARQFYNDMEEDLFITIEKEGIEAFNAAAKRVKCLQLAQGFAYTGEDNKEWKVIHDEKIKALESVIEEAAGMPVLVAYHFRSDLKRICDAFPQSRALDKDPQTIKDWNEGKIPILVAHPASAGHGLSLQHGGNILVYFAHSDNLENHQQILERIGPVRQLQSGYDRPVFVHHIVAADTVEEYAVLPNLEGKGALQDLLMKAMSVRRP